jgi:hypothetical protein
MRRGAPPPDHPPKRVPARPAIAPETRLRAGAAVSQAGGEFASVMTARRYDDGPEEGTRGPRFGTD